MSAAELIEQIRSWPAAEKRELVDKIMDEFSNEIGDPYDDDLSPEQIAEFERRAEELRRNPEIGIPWEQVRAEAKRRFGWK